MVELKSLPVERRETVGKLRNRRLRASGKTPAVLYGHKQDVINLSVGTDALNAVLRHGGRFVQLTGAVNERAFLKDVQWNTWGEAVLHVDFTRVSEHERVRLSVPLELRGEAPGVKDGGVVKQHLHKLEIEADPSNAPDFIAVGINELGFNQQIRIADLAMPEGVSALSDAEALVVECAEPVVVENADAEAVDGAEPEVIGRKKTEEEE